MEEDGEDLPEAPDWADEGDIPAWAEPDLTRVGGEIVTVPEAEAKPNGKPKQKPKADCCPGHDKPEASEKPVKGAGEGKPPAVPTGEEIKVAGVPEPFGMAAFREGCRKASIEPGKPLYMVLATTYRSVLDLKDALKEFGTGAARGLTKDGENELVQRITRQAEMSMRDSMAKHRVRLNWWTSAAVGVLCVLCVSGGAAAGYWVGRDAGQASVHQVARDVAVAFSNGPDEASAVAQLLRHNDLSQMLAECHPFVADGRKACSGAWWMEPAPAAPGTEE